MAVMDIVIKAKDKASGVMNNVQQTGTKAANTLDKHWGKVSVAMGAAGASLEAMARKQNEMSIEVDRLSSSLDMTSGAVRDMAADMSDATFPIEEALSHMKTAVERGLQGEEAIRKFSEQMDFLGDASGQSAEKIAKSTVALESVGIGAENVEEAFDAYGFVLESTTANITQFNEMMEQVGRELGEQAPTVNEMAAALKGLEEQGMTSTRAKRELRQAVRENDGDMDKALETIGLTEEAFKGYLDEVDGSEEYLRDSAQAVEDNTTMLERMQHKAEEVMFRYGDLIGVIGDLSPLLMTATPIVKGLTAAKTALSGANLAAAASTMKLVAAKAVLLAPIAAVVAAIVGLIYIAWELYDSWEEISDFISNKWEAVSDKISNFTDKIGGAISSVVDTATDKWQQFGDFVSSVWDSTVGKVRTNINSIIGFMNTMIDGLNSFSIDIPDWVESVTGMGGSWSLNIPTIPTLHTGGTYRAPQPGGEGPALLKDGEEVIPPGQTSRQDKEGGEKESTKKGQLHLAVLDDELLKVLERYLSNVRKKEEVRGAAT